MNERPLLPGDHIRVRRAVGYYHHGVYMGRGVVAHLAGPTGDKKGDIRVRLTTLSAFRAGGSLEASAPTLPRSWVVRRARNSIGRGNYGLVSRNCETFATWCTTGRRTSEQVKTVAKVAAGALVLGLALRAAG